MLCVVCCVSMLVFVCLFCCFVCVCAVSYVQNTREEVVCAIYYQPAHVKSECAPLFLDCTRTRVTIVPAFIIYIYMCSVVQLVGVLLSL